MIWFGYQEYLIITNHFSIHDGFARKMIIVYKVHQYEHKAIKFG